MSYTNKPVYRLVKVRVARLIDLRNKEKFLIKARRHNRGLGTLSYCSELWVSPGGGG
jgi:hypothetical protein